MSNMWLPSVIPQRGKASLDKMEEIFPITKDFVDFSFSSILHFIKLIVMVRTAFNDARSLINGESPIAQSTAWTAT